jgi:hypothetical protein
VADPFQYGTKPHTPGGNVVNFVDESTKDARDMDDVTGAGVDIGADEFARWTRLLIEFGI